MRSAESASTEVGARKSHLAGGDGLAVFFTLAALIASGVGLALTYHYARTTESTNRFTFFWLSLLLGFLPATYIGLTHCKLARSHRLVLVGYGLLTFIPKYTMSTQGPLYSDEFPHYRQVAVFLRTGDLFYSNTSLPIVKYYPGLALATAAIREISRLSIWQSGELLVLIAHVLSGLLIFEIVAALGFSGRAGFLAAVVFSLNPSFMFFDTQYSYESLGIALALSIILVAVRSLGNTSTSQTKAIMSGCTLTAAIIVTHHVSAAFAAAFLILLVLGNACAQKQVVGSYRLVDPASRTVLVTGLAAVVGLVAWISLFATPTVSYIVPHIQAGFSELVHLFGRSTSSPSPPGRLPTGSVAGAAGSAQSHSLFSGSGAPSYEKALGYVSPPLVLCACVLALGTLRKSKKLFWILSPFTVLACLYFASLPLALTTAGGESAHRSWAFSYIGIAVLVGCGSDVWPVEGAPSRCRLRLINLFGVASLAAVLVGNIAAGESVSYRFPGPYVFGSLTVSRTPVVRQLTSWISEHLPDDQNVVTDRITADFLASGTSWNVPPPGAYSIFQVYAQGDHPDQYLRKGLESGGYTYFVLDMHFESELPAGTPFPGYPIANPVIPAGLRVLYQSPVYELVKTIGYYQIYRLHP